MKNVILTLPEDGDDVNDGEDLLLEIKDRRESKANLERSQLDSAAADYLDRLRNTQNSIPKHPITSEKSIQDDK